MLPRNNTNSPRSSRSLLLHPQLPSQQHQSLWMLLLASPVLLLSQSPRNQQLLAQAPPRSHSRRHRSSHSSCSLTL